MADRRRRTRPAGASAREACLLVKKGVHGGNLVSPVLVALALLGETLQLLFLVEKPQDEVDERRQEDDRLLGVHQDSAEVLILRRGQAPEARRLDVEVVERRRREDERQPEKRRDSEGHAEVGENQRCREAVRLVREYRPPEHEPGRDQEPVLVFWWPVFSDEPNGLSTP